MLEKRLSSENKAALERGVMALDAHIFRQQPTKSVNVKKEAVEESARLAKHKFALDGARE